MATLVQDDNACLSGVAFFQKKTMYFGAGCCDYFFVIVSCVPSFAQHFTPI